ncbi:MAG: DsbA family protein [Actinomycetota bacterium]|nr:DsbA family protein [Actinomycetota bacterium]
MELERKSFLLRPQPEPRTLEEFRSYTQSWRRPAAMEPAVEFRPWESDSAPPSHSVPSAVAGKVAATFGTDNFRRFDRALFRAYFTENRTISDQEVLLEVARQAGLPGNEFAERLSEHRDELVRQVVAEHNQAIEEGIYGVPAVVADQRFLISGAVDSDHYRRVIEHLRGTAGVSGDPASNGS